MPVNVSVIGTVFVDCKGFARNRYHPQGRNPGHVEFVHGGVGRNVAENLANLEVPVTFVSTVDESGLGQEIRDRLERAGIHTGYLLQVPEQGMGMWLVLLDENGNLAGSISQMPDLARLQQWISVRGEEVVKASSHVALELDLNTAISENVLFLAHKHQKPVFGIPGNLDVILERPDFLKKLSCFICNHHEAGQIIGRDLENCEAEELLEQVVSFADTFETGSMVVTMGARGAVYYDRRNGEKGHQIAEKVQLVDASGAGDAFFSGTVMGLARGLDLKRSVRFGTLAAAWTIQSRESTCPDLSQKIREHPDYQHLLVI